MTNMVLKNPAGCVIERIIGSPFDWCLVTGGLVELDDASLWGGSAGGKYPVPDFWMAKYPVTNSQYQAFVEDPDGFRNTQWWEFSPQARQWHLDHPSSKPTAFSGELLPRTRVSWFDSMAFCAWLSGKLKIHNLKTTAGVIRLPFEQEWQRAAIGDSGWFYPWGNDLNKSYTNYGKNIGHPTPVVEYGEWTSPYGVVDMVGNIWEWCQNTWEKGSAETGGYAYRAIRGGAWNVSLPDHLHSVSRDGHTPRGELNDCGLRVIYIDSK